jgi:hypothetical protein
MLRQSMSSINQTGSTGRMFEKKLSANYEKSRQLRLPAEKRSPQKLGHRHHAHPRAREPCKKHPPPDRNETLDDLMYPSTNAKKRCDAHIKGATHADVRACPSEEAKERKLRGAGPHAARPPQAHATAGSTANSLYSTERE